MFSSVIVIPICNAVQLYGRLLFQWCSLLHIRLSAVSLLLTNPRECECDLRPSRFRMSRSHVHDSSLCVAFFAFFSTDFRIKVRLLSVFLHTILQMVSFYFMKWCQHFFSALTRCGHEPVLLWCHAVKLTSFCGMAVNPVRILVPRLKQLLRKCKRGISVVLLAIWQQSMLTPFKQLLFWGIEDNYEEKTVVFLLYVNGEF